MKPSPVAGVFACLVILGCASTGVYVPVQRPAAIRFDRFSAVAVSGTDDRADAGERTDTLAARDFTERLQDRLAELVPRETTIFRTAFPPAENGQLLAVLFSYAHREGVDGLLVASILRMSYHEAVESAVVDDPSLGKTARLARKGVLSGMVVVNMYDIAEQACLRSDTLRTEQRAESRSFGVDPSAIDRDELRTRALRALVDDYATLCTPHTDKEVAVFLLDDRHPDIAKGIRAAGSNRWNDAVAIFERIAAAGKGMEGEDRLLYNLGVAHMYAQDFRSAEAAFRRAAVLSDDQRYTESLERNRRLEEQFLELNRQQR